MSIVKFEDTSSNNNRFYIEIDIKDKWKGFWEQPPVVAAELLREIFQALSTHIVNKPEVDEPEYFIKYQNTIIFRPNHDPSHSIRQVVNTQFFLDIIKLYGIKDYKLGADSFTSEEQAILALAAFLYRAGRTNERPGLADQSNEERSAKLFGVIVSALDFTPELVEAYVYLVQHTYSPLNEELTKHYCQSFTGDTAELQIVKLNLGKSVLHLSHHTDLVRCYPDLERIDSVNKENLNALIELDKVELVEEIALIFARACCDSSGTPYFLHDLAETIIYPYLVLKAKAVNNIAEIYESLTRISRRFVEYIKNGEIEKAQQALLGIQQTNKLPPSIKSEEVSKDIKSSKDIKTFLNAFLQPKFKNILQKFVTERSYDVSERAVGINPKKVSKSNLDRLKQELISGIGLSKEDIARKGQSILLPEEEPLYQMLVNDFEWTLKHVTSSYSNIYHDGNTLKSLHQRTREHRSNKRHTPTDFTGRSDNGFFTIGSPDAEIAEFLKMGMSKGHKIQIPLRDFLKENCPADTMSGLWLGDTWNSYSTESHLACKIGSVERHVNHIKQDKNSLFLSNADRKVYRYQRPDGELVRKLALGQETVTDAELIPFLAYNVLLELRCVGGDFRKQRLNIENKEKIAAFVDLIYGSENFEALVPAKINLEDSRIAITPFIQIPNDTPENIRRMTKAIEEANVDAIQQLLDEGMSVDTNLLMGIVTPLLYTIFMSQNLKYNSIAVIKLLIKNGANTQLHFGGEIGSILDLAVQAGQPAIVEEILKSGIIDSREPEIKKSIDITRELQAILVAIFQQDIPMLTLFKKYGFDYSYHPYAFLPVFAQLSESAALTMLSYFEQNGVNFKATCLYDKSLENKKVIFDTLVVLLKKGHLKLLEKLFNLSLDLTIYSVCDNTSLLMIARKLGEAKAVALLQKNGAIDIEEQTSLKINNHLVIVGEKNYMLLAQYRNREGALRPFYQSIVSDIFSLTEKQLKEAIFTATGIRLEKVNFKIIAETNVDGNVERVVEVKLDRKEKYSPLQTDRWANCKWVQVFSDTVVDDLTTSYIQSPNALEDLFKNRASLIHAIKENNKTAVNDILTKKTSDIEGMALFYACDTQGISVEIVAALLEKGYDINAVYKIESESFTPLMFAILHERLDLIKCLLQHGANINQTVAPYNVTPLMFAAEHSQIETVKFLVECGASFEHPNNRSVLAYVCYKQCSDRMFDYLLMHADKDALFFGYSPLLLVVEQENNYRVEALLKKGVNTHIKHPTKLKTADDLISNDNAALRELFRSYRANAKDTAKTDSKKLSWDDLCKNIDIYLKFTNKFARADLKKLIAQEYGITIIDQTCTKPLQDFAQELLAKASLDNKLPRVQIAIAHRGDLPVFACSGFDLPVIAIHKDYLTKVSYQNLLFFVSYELAALNKFKNNQFVIPTLAERISFDKQVMEKFSYTIDNSVQYLREAYDFFKNHDGEDNFYWPRDVYRGNKYSKNSDYDDRIKLIQVASQNNHNLNSNTQYNKQLPDIKNEISQLKIENYYADFPLNASLNEQYNYLLKNLETLNDELLPFDVCSLASARAKEFCKLLCSLDYDEKQIDTLFEKAQDLEIRCFDFIYRKAAKIYPHTVEKDKLPVWGYFKKMSQAMLKLRDAPDIEAAKRVAQEIVSLQPKVVAHCENVYGYLILEHLYDHGGELPKIRPIITTIGRAINWPQFSNKHADQNLLQWAKIHPIDPNLWKALWICGVVHEKELHKLMPKKALMFLVKKGQDYRYSINEEIPTPVINVMSSNYSRYPVCLNISLDDFSAEDELDTNVLSPENCIKNFEKFVNDNYEDLVSDSLAHTTSTALNIMLSAFSQLASGTEEEKNFVRNFFLDGNVENRYCFGTMFCIRGVPYKSAYIEFILEHQVLFSLYEMLCLVNYIKKDELAENGKDLYIKYLGLNQNKEKDFANFLHVINYLNQSNRMGLGIIYLRQYFLKNPDSLSIFSEKTYQLIECFNNIYGREIQFNVTYYGLLIPHLDWQAVSECQLETSKCIVLFHSFEKYFVFPTQKYLDDFFQLIIKKISAVTDNKLQQELLESFIFIGRERNSSGIINKKLFRQAADFWVKCTVKDLGIDNGTQLYFHKIKQILDRVYKNMLNGDALYVFNKLADKVKSQYLVSSYMGNLVDSKKDNLYSNKKINYIPMISSLLNTLSGADAKIKWLDFISEPLSTVSLNKFCEYILSSKNVDKILKILGFEEVIFDREPTQQEKERTLRIALTVFYDIFWNLKLPERAIAINSLIITPRETLSEELHKKAYEEGFSYVVKKLFPNAHQDRDEEFAVSILMAFLNAAPKHEREFLLAGLLVVSNESSHEKISPARKFVLLCEHLGPAFIKFAQAIHSHPATPEEVRPDFAHVKDLASVPYRWEIWDLLKEVLPEHRFAGVKIGDVLGAASYYLAVEEVTQSGKKQVVRLLRKNAEKDAQRGFAHLRGAVKNCNHVRIEKFKDSILSMIEEAEHMSEIELDYKMGDEQHKIADKLYNKSAPISVTVNQKKYLVYFQACESLESAAGYRTLTLIEGEDFNSLSTDCQKAAAIAFMEKELTLILSGEQFDSDRHHGNFKVKVEGEKILIGEFDFGETLLHPLKKEEIESLAVVIRELPLVLKQKGSIEELFQKHIQNAVNSGKPYSHLMHVKKALLSLNDCRQKLSDDEMKNIMIKIRNNIHPTFAKALAEGATSAMSLVEKTQFFFANFMGKDTQPQTNTNVISKDTGKDTHSQTNTNQTNADEVEQDKKRRKLNEREFGVGFQK